MREFENVPERISGNPPKRNDPYTYYAGQPAMPSLPRYVPEYKKKKKKQPWVSVLVTGLLCSILGGTA